MRILIVEDEAKTADVVRRYLERAGYDARVACDGNEGLAAVTAWQPDLVILDLMLPGMDGREICRRVRATSHVPIVVVTARVLEDDRVAGLLEGADDYLTKPFSPRELVARVHAVLRRAASGDRRTPLTVRFGSLRLDPLQRSAYVGERDLHLTSKEFGLLEALCSTPNVAWNRARLLERVFGWDYEGTDRSVDTHVLNLRRKLVGPACPQIDTVFGVGYKVTVPA